MDAADRLFTHVDEAGNVDYDGLRSDDLDEALDAITAADLDDMDGADRYAFLINAYNIAVLDAVRRRLRRDGRQVASLKRPWTWLRFFLFTPVKVGGRRMSLFRLEFQFLKPHLKRDPRGHFALVCASTGCPPLRDGVFHGADLDDELDAAGHAFLQPGGGYQLDRDEGVLRLNRILKWYRRDFEALGGVRETFLRYAPDADWVREHKPRIAYLSYDWDLNVAG